ncbi:MAG: tetratricopeptide repeat protein [Anaerolineae bacterium]
MYIQTPKRYRGRQSRSAFSCQRFLMFFLLVIVILVGIGIYQMRDAVRPSLMQVVDAGVEQVSVWQATQFAPTPVPTLDPSTVLVDADNNWSVGRVNLALSTYDEIINSLPNDVGVHVRMAEGYLTRGNIEQALLYADRAVTADPFSADAWATRALIYSWNDNGAEGIASAQQALALDANNVRATAYLGYAYYQEDQFTLANSRANEAIDLDLDHWSGYWVRGLIRENVIPIDYPGAQTDFETGYNLAREQNPAMAGVIGSGLGRIISIQGNPQRAVELLNEMRTLDDGNREVLYYLGITHYRDLGEWGQAQDPFSDCVDVAPEDVSCWYMLGRTLFSLDDQEGALQAFEQAVELETPFARHYWWAARSERVLGSCTAATPYLETGYDMVREGGLPAIEEGNADLIQAFEDELSTCRVPIIPGAPEPERTPEAEPIGDA